MHGRHGRIERAASRDDEVAGKTPCEIRTDPFANVVLAGELASSRHDFEEAARCFRQAVALRPDDLDCWTNLGETLLRWCGSLSHAGQVEAASEVFNQAVEALSKAIQLTSASDRRSALRARALVAAAASIYEARKVS